MNSKLVKNKTKASDKKQDWAAMLDVDGKASDITQNNYYRLFRAYANHHAKHPEDVGRTINPIDYPQKWGAWLAYFKKRNLKLARIRQVGLDAAITSDKEQRELHGYQVPADFPSDFDADQDWALDKAAGDIFISKQAKARAAAKVIEETRPPLNFRFKTLDSKLAR